MQAPHSPAALALLARIALLALAACGGARAAEPLWEAGIGVAALRFPHYRGSSEQRTWILPAPYAVYRGELLRIDERRVRALFYETDGADLDLSLNGTVPVRSGDNQARLGMPDLDPTLEIGPSLNIALRRTAATKMELRLPLRAVAAADLPHVRHAGWLFQPSINVDVRDPLGYGGWKLGLQGGPVFSDRRYNRYFYAVDPAFATAARPAYEPGGGFAGTQLIAALSKRYPGFWLGGFAKWDSLGSAVFEDSPLVTAKRHFTAGFAVSWILGRSERSVEARE